MVKQKLIIILGQTASGKSRLAVELARKFDGEVISADSRQVYTGLNIGTGKITGTEMRGVPHHLLDVVSPKKVFTVANFKILAEKKIDEIISRGKVPILCGGTGFYIQAIVDDFDLPKVGPNLALRKKLERQKTEKLFETLKKLDARRASEIDSQNRPRIIRAIEIAQALGKVPVLSRKKCRYDILQIGIKTEQKKLQKKIHDRLLSRIKKGMINEARLLHKRGLSFKRMHELGLEYRYLALYLQKKITYKEMLRDLANEIVKYSKRQMTWFKRNKKILWFSLEPKNKKEIVKTVKNFLL
ncbi:tRNA (adenosine(37)-N6)-dimethylallyltransferase MiaA [Candidatus Parcubacteria bacterium]|nr:tRNA (adenosine(37)-N6)-dimethylallyltransferase MiaA [Candidatus Parcubacteria bacterium]